MNRRTLLPITVVLVLCLVAAGCGWWGGDAKKTPPRPAPASRTLRDLRIEVYPSNMVSVQGSRMPLSSLESSLKQIASEIGVVNTRVIIAPTADTPYGTAVQVIRAARAAGFSTISFSFEAASEPSANP